jgi:polyisoprenoid-binding protein YceI
MMKHLQTAWLMFALGAAGTPGAAAAATPIILQVDPAASEIVFYLQTTWHGVEGRTRAIQGTVTSESGNLLDDGRVEVAIEAATLETGNSHRDGTMKEAHLETGKYPQIAFASTGPPSIVSSSKGPSGAFTGASLTAPGDLSIHGVTRAVVLPVTARRQGNGWRMEGELPVKLSEYAIPDPSIFFNHVQDDVKVVFTITLRPGNAAPTEPQPRGR